MCSRYALTSPPETVRSYFATRPFEPFPPRFNIAPTQPIAIVRTSAAGAGPGRELVLVRWGLLPGWVRDPSAFTTLINARSETAAEKPSFRGAMRHKRCLIPATGFYEWTGPKGDKQPHLIRRPDQSLIAFAGLYETWMGAEGSEIDSAAILTTTSNATLAQIHDRMPVILQAAQFADWLDCRNVEAREAAEMLRPASDDVLEVKLVSRDVNNSRNDGPHLHEAIGDSLL